MAYREGIRELWLLTASQTIWDLGSSLKVGFVGYLFSCFFFFFLLKIINFKDLLRCLYF